MIDFTKKLECKKNYDVIVAGGGVAGCAAAITAANRGLSVLILEKKCTLGGLATGGLVNFMVPMCNGYGRQITKGFAEKWTRKAISLGYDSMGQEWRNGEPCEPIKRRYTTLFSGNIFALVLNDELTSAGVDILYDCVVADTICEKNVCMGVVTSSKAGLEFYGCKMIVDTTGDCDILRSMGVPTIAGENFFTYNVRTITLDGCKKALENGKICDVYSGICGGGINLYGDNQPDDIPKWSGLSPQDVSDYLIRNYKIIFSKLSAEDKLTRDIAVMPDMPQFRTTCRLEGDFTLEVSDCYKHFSDTVCVVNDFDQRGQIFEVPLRALTKKGYPNVITAGRSASGNGYGWDILRVIPAAIMTGQAAGEAVALAVKDERPVYDPDISTLQQNIEADDVMVHIPDSYIPEDTTPRIRGEKI